jgi:hypothetical protein
MIKMKFLSSTSKLSKFFLFLITFCIYEIIYDHNRLMCKILPELVDFEIVCLDEDRMLFIEGCDFHRRQHRLAEQLEMVDATGDFYMKIGNQTFFFLSK